MSVNPSTSRGISIDAIAISGIAIAIASISFTGEEIELKDEYISQAQEIWLFSKVDEAIEEE